MAPEATDNNDNPEQPEDTTLSTNYICLFHLLDCHSTFTDSQEWKSHMLGHFRAHSPPSTTRCPLCPDTHFVDDGDDDVPGSVSTKAWDRMLDHVDTAHYQHGQTLAGSRPDFELMRYLFRMRIISVDEFKVLQLSPARTSPAYHSSQESVRRSVGSSDEPFWVEYSRRREEREMGEAGEVGFGIV